MANWLQQKIVILDKKKFTILDQKLNENWPTDWQNKLSNSHTFIGITIIVFTVILKEWTPRIMAGEHKKN